MLYYQVQKHIAKLWKGQLPSGKRLEEQGNDKNKGKNENNN